mmetsp:Transcript_15558/g.43001  ORF Transcript_15558/g.43001 Transcript_15558/m.43001 type:complete len:215 (+) Transcript_15558:99-743(+)
MLIRQWLKLQRVLPRTPPTSRQPCRSPIWTRSRGGATRRSFSWAKRYSRTKTLIKKWWTSLWTKVFPAVVTTRMITSSWRTRRRWTRPNSRPTSTPTKTGMTGCPSCWVAFIFTPETSDRTLACRPPLRSIARTAWRGIRVGLSAAPRVGEAPSIAMVAAGRMVNLVAKLATSVRGPDERKIKSKRRRPKDSMMVSCRRSYIEWCKDWGRLCCS